MGDLMRTNSILSDPEPTVPIAPKAEKKIKPNDMERIANGSDYPEFHDHIRSRIAYYQQFTPTGIPIAGLTQKERIESWGAAVTIIKEFENLEKTFEAYKRRK